MPLRKFQDIVPPKQRSRERFLHQPQFQENATGAERFSPRTMRTVRSPFRRGTPGGGKRKWLLWAVVVVGILFLVVALLTIFEKTTLKLTPKQTTLPLDHSFTAYKTGGAQAVEGALFFESLSIDIAETKEIPATDIKQVDRRASGQIVIYNNFNSQSQRLIKNTRFETPEGLIYRIQESIIVPGRQDGGGGIAPGSIEVTVYADEPGEKYNIGLRDFTIPGFKGTPRYDGFYARSKTEMSGGFSGVVKTVSENLLENTVRELQTRAREKLLSAMPTHVPEDMILYPEAIFVSFPERRVPPEQTDIDEDSINVTVEGILHGFLFEKNTLSDTIAREVLLDLPSVDRVFVRNLEDLNFILREKGNIDPVSEEVIFFDIKGNPKFIWEFDEQALRAGLAGKSKDSLKGILTEFPSITKAEVTIRPFWKGSFSSNPEDIVIEKILMEGQ